MAEREIKNWITVNGKHIPIYADDEDEKAKQIAQNKEQADILNGKVNKDPTMEFLIKFTGKSEEEIRELEGKAIHSPYIQFREQFEKGINPWEKVFKGSRVSYNDEEWAKIQRNYKLANDAIAAIKKRR